MVGKNGKRRFDDVDWAAFQLLQERGLSLADIGKECGRGRNAVYRAMKRLASYPAEQIMALRREALRRRMLEAQSEILTGDPVRGKRLLDACRSLEQVWDEQAAGAAVSAGDGAADTAAEEALDNDAIGQLRERMLKVAVERHRRAGLARLGQGAEPCRDRGPPP